MIRFSESSDSFIGVVFPIRFLGFVSCELDYGLFIRAYYVFRSVSLELIRLFQKMGRRMDVSNLPYWPIFDSELDYLRALDRASSNAYISQASSGSRLGSMNFGFGSFGDYVATNLRKMPTSFSREKILGMGLFPLYRLEFLKDAPSCKAYPILYKYDAVAECHIILEGVLDPRYESSSRGCYWATRSFIEIGFRNPKDIMIHPTQNQFRYWSDVFLSKLGFNIYRAE